MTYLDKHAPPLLQPGWMDKYIIPTPDGTVVSLWLGGESAGGFKLWLINRDTGEARELLRGRGHEQESPH